MSDDDYTPDECGDHEDSHCDGEGCDHDHEDGSFYAEQHAWDQIDREAREARRGSCLLLLLAFPAAAWLLLAL